MHPCYTRRKECVDWKTLVMSRLTQLGNVHGVNKKVCAGIDMRVSAPFVQRDLMHAHELLDMYDETRQHIGFAFLKTNSTPLYVSLLGSLRVGAGYAIVYELQQTDRFDHFKIVVRSTNAALGFYLKLNFRLFDWSGVESKYVGEGDEDLTQRLRNGATEETRRELHRRSWVNEDEDEWPLLTVRRVALNRSSVRLRSRYEASLLSPKAADRIF